MSTRSHGYVMIHQPQHPRARKLRGYIAEHVLVVERALGKCLPDGAQVHHINGVRDDNRPENLVACNDLKYHMLLHSRAKALAACGHADWIKCFVCKVYGPVGEVERNARSRRATHPDCWRTYMREYCRRQVARKRQAAATQTNTILRF